MVDDIAESCISCLGGVTKPASVSLSDRAALVLAIQRYQL